MRKHLKVTLEVTSGGEATLKVYSGINVGDGMSWSTLSSQVVGTLQATSYYIGVKVVTL